MEALTLSLLQLAWSSFPEDSTYGVFMGGVGDKKYPRNTVANTAPKTEWYKNMTTKPRK